MNLHKKIFWGLVALVMMMTIMMVHYLSLEPLSSIRTTFRDSVAETVLGSFQMVGQHVKSLLGIDSTYEYYIDSCCDDCLEKENVSSEEKPCYPRLHMPPTRIRELPKEFEKEPPAIHDPAIKKILVWNDFLSSKHYWFGLGREPFVQAKCPVNTCLLTAERNRYPPHELDAILWHYRSNDRSLPKKRSPNTRYIFTMMESAVHLYGNLAAYDGLFNWTFTYRLDSDIVWPYSFMTPLPPELRRNRKTEIQEVVTNKTKMAAWFVSNCNSKSGREQLVKGLQKHIVVDVYGGCGNMLCPVTKSEECHLILQQDYKFYLAFENSLCQDYVTEKLFTTLEYYVVPVVWGLANYSRHAPPHSYINALDFTTIKDLVDYLIYLSNNNTAYMEYFRWKEEEEVVGMWSGQSEAFCTLCKKLHEDDKPKVYNRLYDWFVCGSRCLMPSDSMIKKFLNSF